MFISHYESVSCVVMTAGAWLRRCWPRHPHQRCHWRRCRSKNVVSSLKLRWKRMTSCFSSSRQRPLPSNSINNNNNNCPIRLSTRMNPRPSLTRTQPHSDTPTLPSACRTRWTPDRHSCILRMLVWFPRTWYSTVNSRSISVSCGLLSVHISYNYIWAWLHEARINITVG